MSDLALESLNSLYLLFDRERRHLDITSDFEVDRQGIRHSSVYQDALFPAPSPLALASAGLSPQPPYTFPACLASCQDAPFSAPSPLASVSADSSPQPSYTFPNFVVSLL